MSEYNKIVEMQKEYLPNKAKKLYTPMFVWIEALLHAHFSNNWERKIFNTALQTVGQLHEDVVVLPPKKIWDPENKSLFLDHENHFTTDGLRFYWEAVDKTVKYVDTILSKKLANIRERARKAANTSVNDQQPSVQPK